jgi:hypothetical protein
VKDRQVGRKPIPQKKFSKPKNQKPHLNSGLLLNRKESTLLAKLYTSQPSIEGINAKVKREFEEAARHTKGIRKTISKLTIARFRNMFGLEEMRLKNFELIKDKLRQAGEEGAESNLKLTQRIKGAIAKALLTESGELIPEPTVLDLDRTIRLESFLQGGPDSRPDNPINIGVIVEDDKIVRLEQELEDNLTVLGRGEVSPINRR